MKIIINNTTRVPKKEPEKRESSYDDRFGAWGFVTKLHSEAHSVDVMIDLGINIPHVPVASKEWVIFGQDVDKNFNSGMRDLPPVGSRVFLMMPSFSFDDCFVAPFSCFNSVDKNVSFPFLEKGQENRKEQITPSGWSEVNNYATGTYSRNSPDGRYHISVDYGTEKNPKENIEVYLNVCNELVIEHFEGDKCKVKIFDTEIVIREGSVTLKPKDTTIEVDGDAILKASGNISIEAEGNAEVKTSGNVAIEATGNAEVSAAQVEIKGNVVQVDGTAVATGSGGFCGIPNCLFTGAPHVTNVITNAENAE